LQGSASAGIELRTFDDQVLFDSKTLKAVPQHFASLRVQGKNKIGKHSPSKVFRILKVFCFSNQNK
jgi:hypothetical protein